MPCSRESSSSPAEEQTNQTTVRRLYLPFTYMQQKLSMAGISERPIAYLEIIRVHFS